MIKRISVIISSVLLLFSVTLTSAAEKKFLKQEDVNALKKNSKPEEVKMQQKNLLQNRVKPKVHGDPHVDELPPVIKDPTLNKVKQ